MKIRLCLSLSLIVPDVLCAVGEPHPVMPVAARTAAAAASASPVEMVAMAVPVPVTQVASADSEGGLLGLVAPPESWRQ